MKLIVFYPIVCIENIGCTPIKLRVPPLSLMKRCSNIKRIIYSGWGFKISTNLYTLFKPIKEYSHTKYHHYISPIWLMKKNRIKNDVKICQSKEMSPYKFETSLYFLKGWLLQRFHGFFLPICYKHSTLFIKNTVKIIELYDLLLYPSLRKINLPFNTAATSRN